jgi:hypothetical protein
LIFLSRSNQLAPIHRIGNIMVEKKGPMLLLG